MLEKPWVRLSVTRVPLPASSYTSPAEAGHYASHRSPAETGNYASESFQLKKRPAGIAPGRLHVARCTLNVIVHPVHATAAAARHGGFLLVLGNLRDERLGREEQ